LNVQQKVCTDRLLYRRYDPNSSRVINLQSLPSDISADIAATWIHAPADTKEKLAIRFREYEAAERDLKKAYGLRNGENATGIMHGIDNPGIGEGDAQGHNQFIEKCFERVEACLLRPIPNTTQ
jgi:hypothetical protein